MIGVGTVLAESYRIEAEIGRGGMSVVYRATHLRLPTRVAIKVLHAHLSDGTAKSRFRREAEMLAALKHPNIVAAHDFHEVDGFPFFVMEFLDGEDLARLLLRDRKLPLVRVLPLVRQMADALSAAHGRGIVHRDLKPQNVFLCNPLADGAQPTVKLLDFGISKLLGSSEVLTASALTMGTPSYMSPEQARGESGQVDARADQFALALLVYETLSGTHPFRHEEAPLVTMSRIVTAEAPPIAEMPAALMQVLQRALAKQSDARWPSVQAFATAFERSAEAEVRSPTVPSVTRTARLRWKPWGWALLAVIASLLAGALALRHQLGHPKPAPAPMTVAPSAPQPNAISSQASPSPLASPPAPLRAAPSPGLPHPSPGVTTNDKKKSRRPQPKAQHDPQFRLEDPFAP